MQQNDRRLHSGHPGGLGLQMCAPLMLALVLTLAGRATASAQANVVLSGPPTCQQCRIEVERIIAFGDAHGPGMLQEQATIATDRRGRFYVSSNYDPTIAVFEPSGRFLRRIGREGPGPGEFTYPPTMLFGPGDTLYALDLIGRRMAVFSAQYNLVRTAPLRVGPSAAVRASDGRFVSTGAIRFADGIGYPFHLMGADGTHISSFGSATGELDLYSAMDGYREMAAPRGSTLWTSNLDAYVLEQWSLDGKRLARLTREVPWFPAKAIDRRRMSADKFPPPTMMTGLAEDSAGLVWTLATTADQAWRPREFPKRPDRNSRFIPDSLRHKIWDSTLEVIDPARGVVLATRRFDTLFKDFIAPNLLVSFEEDADGNPRYVVWRTQIVSSSK